MDAHPPGGAGGPERRLRGLAHSLLQTQIDPCWARVGGVDPARYILKYPGSAPVVQHKDFDSSKDGQLNVESDIVNEARKALSAGTFPFRAVGHGIMDIPGIVKAAEKAGAQWLVVEQDLPSPGQTPIECAKESLDYLNIMLISGGFVSPVPVLLKPSRGKALR